MKTLLLLALLLCVLPSHASGPEHWRAATPAELAAALPARAPAEKEHIETEMRTATGIVDAHGRVIASVVLITAGYAADGKYSHYLLVQAPMTIDGSLQLAPGAYLVGWKRTEDGLLVHIFDSASGAERGTGRARPQPGKQQVVSFHIWPPTEHKGIQIGRFFLPYSLP